MLMTSPGPSKISCCDENKVSEAAPRFPRRTRPRAATCSILARIATSFWAMERSIRLRSLEETRVPLPVIGVRRGTRQDGAHDDAHRHEPFRTGCPPPVRGRAVAAECVFSEGGGGVSPDSWTPG